jgi:hypothetical protein
MSEHRATAEEWLRGADGAQTLTGQQTYLLRAAVNLLLAIDDTLQQLLPPQRDHGPDQETRYALTEQLEKDA